MRNGLFVVFEGIDGSGTTTQSERLAEDLERRGHDIVYTREPGGTPLGEQIRGLVLDPQYGSVDPVCELLLCAAGRRQHVHELIGPALQSGKPVICDRYAASTVAYQGAGRGLDSRTIATVNELAMDGYEPDLTILLDISVGEAMGRRRNRQEDRLEQSGRRLQELARDGYRDYAAADPERCVIIDASAAEDVVFESVKDTLIARWPSFPFRAATSAKSA